MQNKCDVFLEYMIYILYMKVFDAQMRSIS